MNKVLTIISAAALTVLCAASANATDLSLGNLHAAPYVAVEGGVAYPNKDADNYNSATTYGAATGLDFHGVRTELEVSRASQDYSIKNDSRVNATLVGINVFAEPVTFRGFTPFVGVGVAEGFFTGAGLTKNTDDVVYSGQLGTAYNINQNWALTVAYRHSVSDSDIVKQNDGSYDNYSTNSVLGTVRYTF